ncbi:MAG: phospholipase D-like domain-containing protein [Patescibacteria group bacterium]|nr:phospholipase D-like domain-containing protein [Patescibacteria group bacterium]
MRYKFKKWRLLVGVVLFILALFILSLLSRWGARLIGDWLTIKSKPAYSVVSPTPLEADILFNDEPGTEIFSERIIKELNSAKKSVEVAMYTFSSEKLKQALYQASDRGLKVTIISDVSNHNSSSLFFAEAPADLIWLEAGSNNGGRTTFMHHKFAIIDRGESEQKLIFGSYNWTDLQEKYDPSFLMFSANGDLINSFGREFERLVNGDMGIKKLNSPNYHPWDLSLQIEENNYEVWFSPGRLGDSVTARLDSLINSATSTIDIMIWDFTDKDLALDIVRQARAGIKVRLITDTWNFNNQNSVFRYLLSAKERYSLDNFELILDKGNGLAVSQIKTDADLEADFDPFLHYHVLIVDDAQVLFGTNNWSRSGAYYNDESIIVTNDQVIISNFKEAFAKQYRNNKLQ